MNLNDLKIRKNKYYTTYTYHSKYSFFVQFADWNVHALSGSQKANGLIVQQVKMQFGDKRNFHYYEAWNVLNGIVVDKRTISDDMFCDDKNAVFGDYNYFWILPSASLEKSVGIIGYCNIFADVYWIDSNNEMFSIISNWRRDEVEQANGLLSIPAELLNSNYKEKITTFFKSHRIFRHSWDFTNEANIIECVSNYIVSHCKMEKECLYKKNVDILLDSFHLNKYEYLKQNIKNLCYEKLDLIHK